MFDHWRKAAKADTNTVDVFTYQCTYLETNSCIDLNIKLNIYVALKNQTRYVHVWLPEFTSVSRLKHSQVASLSQLHDWLIWHYNVT